MDGRKEGAQRKLGKTIVSCRNIKEAMKSWKEAKWESWSITLNHQASPHPRTTKKTHSDYSQTLRFRRSRGTDSDGGKMKVWVSGSLGRLRLSPSETDRDEIEAKSRKGASWNNAFTTHQIKSLQALPPKKRVILGKSQELIRQDKWSSLENRSNSRKWHCFEIALIAFTVIIADGRSTSESIVCFRLWALASRFWKIT